MPAGTIRCRFSPPRPHYSTIISQAPPDWPRQRGVGSRPRAGLPARDWSMPNKMLIDAAHPEETRVVVLRGNRVEEFDFESANRKQLRGNIYLAKVTRVEPSLQAAFVDYGGNRHGFLAFSEIHPDYYQIPVADRQPLIAEAQRAQRAADDELDRRSRRHRAHGRRSARRDDEVVRSDIVESPAPEASEIAEAQSTDDTGAFAESTAPHDETGEQPDISKPLPERPAVVAAPGEESAE